MSDRSSRLARALKAYDLRGRVGDDLDDDLLFALGWGTARTMAALHAAEGIVIGADMRPDSLRFAQALARGVSAAGSTPTLLGLCSTDQLYFASGRTGLPGLMVTASHNPSGWNGVKVCGPRAAGISRTTGLADIAEAAVRAPAEPVPAPAGPAPDTAAAARVAAGYAQAIREQTGLLDLPRRLSVVADCGSGMAGKLLPEVFGTAVASAPLPLDVRGMYTELDGTFPHHPANPLDPANLVDVRREVLATGADLGLAFDGDADRCFVIDETGRATSASAIGALVARREIARARAAGEDAPVVLHNLITSRAVPEQIVAAGGVPVRTPVGHSGIKRLMSEHSAVFACEHSAHFYFRDFYGADSGMLAACHVIAALAASGGTLSALLADLDPYAGSGEINSAVDDPAAALARFRDAARAGAFGPGEVDELDGVTLTGADFWCNVRSSNTEPLVRFNCETPDPGRTAELTADVLALVRGTDRP
ncbi:phosphomannomutase/phosphoglucomutase [Brevibacterium ihuae]|uniref:phosphomannomutase/phosphoglucomutase n=1 Tax=Brevibacterium ihuae TaxID=1631743 RepID=UPI000C76FF5B|nr:phosphomannomutase/phosphoglucomutase [Brevibacterium ihuae]